MIIISNLPDAANSNQLLTNSGSNHGGGGGPSSFNKNHHQKQGCPPTRMAPSRTDSGTPLYRMAPGRTDSDLSTLSSHSAGSMFSTASDVSQGTVHTSSASAAGFVHSYKKPVMPPRSQYLAMDCEMCGTLTGQSVCARVVLTDWKGRSVLDTYVKPSEQVTDYRTFVSGITAEHLENAPSLQEVQQQVVQLLRDKILVGHGLENDLKALNIDHPWYMMRDTAHYEPFMKTVSAEVYARSPQGRQDAASVSSGSTHSTTSTSSSSNSKRNLLPRKLKDLAKQKLNRDIQVAGQAHSPVEDAVAALDLYKSHRPRWEACINSQLRESSRHSHQQVQQQQVQAQAQQPPLQAIGLPAHVVQQQLQHRQAQQQQQQQMLMMQQQQQQQQMLHQYQQYQHQQYQNLQRPRYYQQQQVPRHQQQTAQQQYHHQAAATHQQQPYFNSHNTHHHHQRHHHQPQQQLVGYP